MARERLVGLSRLGAPGLRAMRLVDIGAAVGMTPARCSAWLLGLLCWAGTAAALDSDLAYPATEPTGEEIARQIYFVNHFYAFRNIAYGGDERPLMVVLERRADGAVGTTTVERYANHAYDEGSIKSRDLVIFRSGQLRGTGILVTEFKKEGVEMAFSVWLPALRKIRRFSEPSPGERWGNSILTYGDIYLRRPEHERHQLLGSEIFEGCLDTLSPEQLGPHRDREVLPRSSCEPQGRRVYRLRSEPIAPDWWYDHRIRWVDAETFADYRSLYFDGERLVKRVDKSWRSAGLDDPRALYWDYWYALDPNRGDEAVAIAPPGAVAWNLPLPSRLWSETSLRRLKR